MNQIRVVVADDHAMVRDGLRGWIEQEEDLTVIGEATTGRQSITLCEFERPDVLLQELTMPDTTGLEVIRQLKAAKQTVRIIAISNLGHSYALLALDAGADGFLSKDERRGVVIEAIRWAATKTSGTFLSPLAAQATLTRDSQLRKYHLTFTEQSMLRFLKYSNREIATRLFITEGTVKNHISTIYSKLGLRNRQQAIEWAELNGFLLAHSEVI